MYSHKNKLKQINDIKHLNSNMTFLKTVKNVLVCLQKSYGNIIAMVHIY